MEREAPSLPHFHKPKDSKFWRKEEKMRFTKAHRTGALKQPILNFLLINGNNWGSTKDVELNKSLLRFYYVPGGTVGTWVAVTPMDTTDKTPALLVTGGGKEIEHSTLNSSEWRKRKLLNPYQVCCCQVASVVSDSVQPYRWQPTRLLCP